MSDNVSENIYSAIYLIISLTLFFLGVNLKNRSRESVENETELVLSSEDTETRKKG